MARSPSAVSLPQCVGYRCAPVKSFLPVDERAWHCGGMASSLPSGYFERLYGDAVDPWGISRGWYEERKRALVLAALPRPRFALALEPGCGNGDLTAALGARCDRLIAWEVVDAAIDRARARTADLPGVEIHRGALPGGWPELSAELIVLSEVGYYLDEADLRSAIGSAAAHLAPGGHLVGVHWRRAAPDYPLTGDRVHEVIGAEPGLTRIGGYLDADFALGVWAAGDIRSVAEVDGVV
jgi:SAM-dependent methyltransferase